MLSLVEGFFLGLMQYLARGDIKRRISSQKLLATKWFWENVMHFSSLSRLQSKTRKIQIHCQLQYEYLLLHSQGHHNLVFSGLRNRSADLFPADQIMLIPALSRSLSISPDDVLVLFVLPLALLPSSVHHAGINVGRAGSTNH